MEEYVDVLDNAGKPTGERKLKSAVHRDGDRHKAAHVWLMNPRGELLIQLRAAVKENHPNLWDTSYAGHVSAGETSLDAVVREGEEELGIAVKKEDAEFLFTVDGPRVLLNGDKYIDHEFNDIYLVQLKEDNPTFRLQDEEVAKVKWVPWRDLEQMMLKESNTFVPHDEEHEGLFQVLRRRM